ncbi:MAG: gfo/Idh/MocA family oxidoreductase, partial [Mobilicoccus sp.]|nr:gfo/Idh/MocA family oxidoreductase [Mobilicoccus sp.]
HLTVTGTSGSIRCGNFMQPHLDDSLEIRRDGCPVVVENVGTRSSYTYQLEAFTALVRSSTGVGYDTLVDAVDQAEFVDAAYRAAGLGPRPTIRT